MDNALLIFLEPAAAISLFYSCRCYVKHVHSSRQTSRRKFAYYLLALAVFFMCFAVGSGQSVILSHSLIIFLFGFYIGYKTKKHKKISKHDKERQEQQSVITQDYHRWFCMMLAVMLFFIILEITVR